MIVFLFPILLFTFFVFLFCRAVRIDAKRLVQNKHDDNERLLQDMQRFIAKMEAEQLRDSIKNR